MSGQSAREALKEKDTSEVICFYKYIKHGRQEKISMTNGGLIFLKNYFVSCDVSKILISIHVFVLMSGSSRIQLKLKLFKLSSKPLSLSRQLEQ